MRSAEPERTRFAQDLRYAPAEVERRLWSRLRDRRLAGFKFMRQEGEGASTDKAHSGLPPHHRLPPRFADDEVGKALSPRAGRGGGRE